MCGIAGIVTSTPGDLRLDIEAMTHALTHRGPDDFGFALFEGAGAALGMRRLSILDLETGQQPMWNEDRSYCVVFNGEIYNFAELRQELSALGHVFATDHSDTEVLVHGVEEWGTDLFARLNGMFAIAIWDTRNERLILARDRTGKKPIYLARVLGGHAFASELKALLRYPGLTDRELDLEALEQYLSFDYILGPRTILRSVEKLPAAHYAIVTRDGFTTHRYWSPRFEHSDAPEPVVLAELDRLLGEAVRMRMVADVPIGLFLSGGLDSTTVGWYMRRESDNVHSFSIGFEDKTFDESAYARQAAESLGTTHHLEVFSQSRIRDLVPRIADILDEPMGDQSIFPTYLLSEFTRTHVKVALGGDGSDELLMGYKAYRPLKAAWMLDSAPYAVRRLVAASSRRLPVSVGGAKLRWVRFARSVDRTPTRRLLNHLGSFKGDARWILSGDVRSQLPLSLGDGVDDLVMNGSRGRLSGQDETVAAYLHAYLQEDILVKVDRASMAASLEVRAPFLDRQLVDFALAIPPSLRLKGLTGKYVLRRLMRGRIPDEIIDRKKLGFGVPLNSWLRNSLAPTVREYLDPPRVAAEGIFDPAGVAALVDQHLSGRADRGQELWLLLQFQLWKERWLG